jgi:hypothetical protein
MAPLRKLSGCPSYARFLQGTYAGLSRSSSPPAAARITQDQPRFKPLAKRDFYPDLRSARPPVEGTVARGEFHEDTYFYSGKMGDSPGDYMPFAVTQADLDRGRERFNIYCAPCHSRIGDGNGMIPQRGFRHPPTYHDERMRGPAGIFFHVITEGFGAMPDYAHRFRRATWCIVALFARCN